MERGDLRHIGSPAQNLSSVLLHPLFVLTCLQIELLEGGIVQKESEFSAELTARMLTKLDWAALKKTAAEVSQGVRGCRGAGTQAEGRVQWMQGVALFFNRVLV